MHYSSISFSVILVIVLLSNGAQSKPIVIDENNWEEQLSKDEWMVEL